MVARMTRVARLPTADHHGTPKTPDVHPRGRPSPPIQPLLGCSLPAESVVSSDVEVWWQLVQGSPHVAQLRADGRRSLLAVAGQLMRAAQADLSTMPTWELLTQETGLSRATVARRLAGLRAAGLLGVLETGAGTQAAVYVLCQPQRPAGVA